MGHRVSTENRHPAGKPADVVATPVPDENLQDTGVPGASAWPRKRLADCDRRGWLESSSGGLGYEALEAVQPPFGRYNTKTTCAAALHCFLLLVSVLVWAR